MQPYDPTRKERREVRIDDVTVTFFGRAGLNELDPTRLQFMRDLYDVGHGFEPIAVTRAIETIDGRHRLAILKERGAETIIVDVYDVTRVEALALAVRLNGTGPLPATRADIRSVLQQMRAAGATDDEMVRLLKPTFPRTLVKQQIDWNRSNAKHMALRAAMRLRNEEDLSYPEAAKRASVDADELREFVKTGRRKGAENAFMALKKTLQDPNKSYGGRVKNALIHLEDAWQQGALTERQALELLNIPIEYGHRLVRSGTERKEKFFELLSAQKAVSQ